MHRRREGSFWEHICASLTLSSDPSSYRMLMRSRYANVISATSIPMNIHFTLAPIVCVVLTLSPRVCMAASPVTGQNVNYAITPDFPPPPRPEPFVVTTIPLPPNVTDAILVNYLADGEHLVMEVQIAGRSRADIATMKEDGSDFRCLTDGVKGDIGGEMPVPLPDGKRVYTPTGILECSPSILDCKEARILPLVYPKIKG